MRRKRGFGVLLLAVLMVMVVAQTSFGAGFALYEGSARGNALGGAMVGRADDPSALFYNPAGITQLPGMQFMAGATFIMPSTNVNTYQGGVWRSTGTEDNVWFPPHMYATYQFNDSLWFGLAAFSPFGLGTEFDSNWVGRYNNYEAVIQTLTLNPNVAYKITDKLSAAAGLDFMYFDITYKKKIPGYTELTTPIAMRNPMLDSDISLEGDSWGYGWNVGLHYKAFDWMSLGLAYRSEVSHNIHGTADFTKSMYSNYPATFYNDTDASAKVTLPAELFMGVNFKILPRLTWEVGAIWTQWSSYQELKVKFDEPVAYLSNGTPISTMTATKKYKDVWRINTGLEYKALDWLDLRLGYVWDQEPSRDEYADYLVPASNRHMITSGLGFHWNNWTFDVSYTYLMIESRSIFDRAADGILMSTFEDGDAHLVGVSVSYKF
jgi:long-chain fatty acid transport protein